MSEDLLERLRNIDHNWHEAACSEAADEIERLRAEVTRALGAERYLVAEWLLRRARWIEENSHGEDVVAISAELRNAADTIEAEEHLK